MEFKNFISRPGKSWNLIGGPWKSWKIKVRFDRLFSALRWKGQDNVRYRGVIKQRKRHAFWRTPEFVSVELFTVKKCSKTSKGFVFLKLTAKPKVLESLKRSWKKSWKVMEFKELKRVRTLEFQWIYYLFFSGLGLELSIADITKT